MLERVFANFLGGPAQQETQAVEVTAVNRDGRQIPVELSISVVRLSPTRCNLVAFCRDISERKEGERLRSLQDLVSDVLADTDAADAVGSRVLELVCAHLDWAAGALWRVDPVAGMLRCEEYWQTDAVVGIEMEGLTRRATYARGGGVPGQAWATREAAWHEQLVRVAESVRELAALRAGLQSVGAFPLQDRGEVLGVLEFFGPAPGQPSAAGMARVEGIGRRLARVLGRLWAEPEPPIVPVPSPPQLHVLRTVGAGALAPAAQPVEMPAPAEAPAAAARYKIDTRHSRLGFSCAFMKFLTVHGRFDDFSGWVELEGDDVSTARVECVIRTATVDTGSLDRDYHLCSEDFFAVESYPEMVFRSSSVERRGDERFRMRGELTIRTTTRPLTLDVRLEDRERDGAGGERATLSATTIIDRTDWFLDWEEALEAGRWIVGEQIRLELEVALVRRAGVPGAAD